MRRSTASPRQSARIRSQRGSIILFVLGLILLTSFMLMRFIERAHTELLTEAKHGQQIPLRHEAYSALQITFAVLEDIADIDEGLHSPEQGWGNPLEYFEYQPSEGIELEIIVEDESAKLSLATADAETLTALLTTMEISISDAERITDAILAWSQPDYVARFSDSEPSTYRRRDPPLTPPQRPVRTFDELRLMPAVLEILCDENGEWNETGRRFLENISLIPFEFINLNTGRADVLSALGMSDANLLRLEDRRLTDGREPPRPYYSLADAGADLGSLADNPRFGTEAQILRITIHASQGGRVYKLVALVQTGESQARPASPETPEDIPEPTSEPRPWTLNNIDSPFQILDIRENDGF